MTVNEAERFAGEAVESLNMLGVLASPGGYSKLVQSLGEAAAAARAGSALRGCERFAATAAQHSADERQREQMSSVELTLRALAEAWENGRMQVGELESASRSVLESMGMPRAQ